MKRRARKPSWTRELCVALGLSLVGGAVFAALSLLVPFDASLRATVALLAFTYMCYGLGRSAERTGRIVVVGLWCVLAAAAWVLGPPLGVYLAMHAALVWLVRSLYSDSGLPSAGADLILTALSLAFGVWAALRTESFFLATWCFFLIQSMHVFVPAALQTRRSGRPDPRRAESPSEGFESAFRAAENALRRLTRAH